MATEKGFVARADEKLTAFLGYLPVFSQAKCQGSFSGTWFRRYRRNEMELGSRVSFARGFRLGRASEPQSAA